MTNSTDFSLLAGGQASAWATYSLLDFLQPVAAFAAFHFANSIRQSFSAVGASYARIGEFKLFDLGVMAAPIKLKLNVTDVQWKDIQAAYCADCAELADPQRLNAISFFVVVTFEIATSVLTCPLMTEMFKVKQHLLLITIDQMKLTPTPEVCASLQSQLEEWVNLLKTCERDASNTVLLDEKIDNLRTSCLAK